MKKFKKYNIKEIFNMRKNTKVKIGILIFLCLIIGLSIFSISRALLEEQVEIKSVEIKSDGWDKNEPGAWKITKSAEWTGLNTAQIKFEVNTIAKYSNTPRDIVLVLDTSGSMDGEKLIKVKEDSKQLINKILSNSEDKIALIEFNSEATLLSNFSTNKNVLLNYVENLTASGGTSYESAFENMSKLLENYTFSSSRNLNILFMTDGYPDSGNQDALYKILKTKYPQIGIKGIQYEMGTEAIDELKNVTDEVFIASMKTLDNVLVDAAMNPEHYEKFDITDYVNTNFFYLNSVDDIKFSVGKVEILEENGTQKVIWNFDEFAYVSGSSSELIIDVILKENFEKHEGLYPTNNNEIINIKLESDLENIVNSKKVPILQAGYEIIYDTNPPDDCDIKKIRTDVAFAFENVTKSNEQLQCNGYEFKGWEIVEDDVVKINDDIFVMPTHDIHIRAIWTKLDIEKKMDGVINSKLTLWKQIKNNVGYGYITLLASSSDENFPIYYYSNKGYNNVIFAGFCWQIVRTTETGGVKLVYNGVPSTTNTCNNTGNDTQIGNSSFIGNGFLNATNYMYSEIKYEASTQTTWLKNFLWGNSVSYDGEFYTLNDVQQLEYGIVGNSNSKWSNIHYTCLSTSETQCEEVYYLIAQTQTSANNGYFIKLSNGITIEDLLSQALGPLDDKMDTYDVLNKESVYYLNKVDSLVKKDLDNWFEIHLLEFNKYIENTIWCNDRSYDLTKFGPYNPNGGNVAGSGGLGILGYFNGYSSRDLFCPRKIDRFTVSDNVNDGGGNGDLKYPIGLLTYQEVILMGKGAITGSEYWTMTPYVFAEVTSYVGNTAPAYITTTGSPNYTYAGGSKGVRPSISLIRGVTYSKGNGTVNSPYIIDVE